MPHHSLTIACATYRDDEGVWFTFTQLLHALEQLRNSHPQSFTDWNIELLIADNDPQAIENSRWLQRFCHSYGIRYVVATQVVSTAFPRDYAIRLASSDYAMVLDSHVYLTSSSIRSLLDYLEKHWGTDDLIQGPLIYDLEPVRPRGSRLAYDDCYVPVWRNEMLGISSRVWICSCGQFFFCPFPDPVLFNPQSRLRLWDATLSDPYLQNRAGEVTSCPVCGRRFPDGELFIGHEQLLTREGFQRAIETNTEVYPIPMLGTGLFCAKRKTWLGFAPGMRGFGGEEGLIHGMYRAAGRQVLCVKGLEWRHYFGPRHVRAPVRKLDKARNFVIMAKYAGRRTVQDIYDHFVKGTNNVLQPHLTEEQWKEIMSEANKPCTACSAPTPSTTSSQRADTQEARKVQVRLPHDVPGEIAEWLQKFVDQTKPDIANEFAQLLWHIGTVAEALRGKRAWVAGRLADLIGLLVAYSEPRPESVVVLSGGHDAGVPLEVGLPTIARQDNVVVDSIDSADVLVLSRYYLYGRFRSLPGQIAEKFGRIVVLWADVTYATNDRKIVTEFDRGMAAFLDSHPGFSRVYYTNSHGGLAILSKLREDKKQPPPIWKLVPRYLAFKAWFWLRSLFGGKGYLPASEARKRWDICLLCDARFGERCGECGCYLRQFPNGAFGRVWYRDRDCPKGKWPQVE